MELRSRDPAVVRVDALRMASKKLDSGCAPCAQAYHDLARRNGASEKEIQESVAGGSRKRRSAPIVSLAAAVALPKVPDPAADMVPVPKRPLTEEEIRSVHAKQKGRRVDPFGIDSCTPPGIGGMPTQFYIGELGCIDCILPGPCPGCPDCFDVNSAAAAGYFFTHGYWGLAGPGSRPPDLADNYLWGRRQAFKAADAWSTGPRANLVGGQTIFADIEAGFGGWGTDQAANADLLNGFLDAIVERSLSPGVYMNISQVSTTFSPGYVPSKSFVYWGVGTINGLCVCCPSVNNCSPCNPGCDTKPPVQQNWTNGVFHACFGLQSIQVWQFWIDNCTGCCACANCPCNGDFDYSPQSGSVRFVPMNCS
jgi:hypothetical protein